MVDLSFCHFVLSNYINIDVMVLTSCVHNIMDIHYQKIKILLKMLLIKCYL